ncbi:hypothetical protein ES319_D11G007100v1 [Gossypium barbadense]|uniref:Photosystem II cytochrome b559 N-terminal domain-containing protein n=1 Tax=Gossypium barbadense TaxID=3634 RepID=A0A5J5P5E9_GOSBA|nr:hypothetical protein ES319_D11G007100v1 [Gossypium barbadense]
MFWENLLSSQFDPLITDLFDSLEQLDEFMRWLVVHGLAVPTVSFLGAMTQSNPNEQNGLLLIFVLAVLFSNYFFN